MHSTNSIFRWIHLCLCVWHSWHLRNFRNMMIYIRLPGRMCLSVSIWMRMVVIRKHSIHWQKHWIVWINIICFIIIIRQIHWTNCGLMPKGIRPTPEYRGLRKRRLKLFPNGFQGFASSWAFRMQDWEWSTHRTITGIFIWIFWTLHGRIRNWRAAIFHWKQVRGKWLSYYLWSLLGWCW